MLEDSALSLPRLRTVALAALVASAGLLLSPVARAEVPVVLSRGVIQGVGPQKFLLKTDTDELTIHLVATTKIYKTEALEAGQLPAGSRVSYELEGGKVVRLLGLDPSHPKVETGASMETATLAAATDREVTLHTPAGGRKYPLAPRAVVIREVPAGPQALVKGWKAVTAWSDTGRGCEAFFVRLSPPRPQK